MNVLSFPDVSQASNVFFASCEPGHIFSNLHLFRSQVYRFQGHNHAQDWKQKVENTLSTGINIPGVFNSEESFTSSSLSQQESKQLISEADSDNQITGTMPTFVNNRVATSKRSKDPGILKATLGPICDIISDEWKPRVNESLFQQVFERCHALYEGNFLCYVGLRQLEQETSMVLKSRVVAHVAEHPSCHWLGPLIFNKRPHGFHSAHVQDGVEVVSGIGSLSSCVENCQERSPGCQAAFFHETRCVCYNMIPGCMESCRPEQKCEGMIFALEDDSEYVYDGERFDQSFPLSFGDFTVGDVLGVSNHSIILQNHQREWIRLVDYVDSFINDNYELNNISLVKDTLQEIVFNSGRSLCTTSCRNSDRCVGFHVRPLFDWTALTRASDHENSSIPIECVLYAERGLQYIVGWYSPFFDFAGWMDRVPTGRVFLDNWRPIQWIVKSLELLNIWERKMVIWWFWEFVLTRCIPLVMSIIPMFQMIQINSKKPWSHWIVFFLNSWSKTDRLELSQQFCEITILKTEIQFSQHKAKFHWAQQIQLHFMMLGMHLHCSQHLQKDCNRRDPTNLCQCPFTNASWSHWTIFHGVLQNATDLQSLGNIALRMCTSLECIPELTDMIVNWPAMFPSGIDLVEQVCDTCERSNQGMWMNVVVFFSMFFNDSLNLLFTCKCCWLSSEIGQMSLAQISSFTVSFLHSHMYLFGSPACPLFPEHSKPLQMTALAMCEVQMGPFCGGELGRGVAVWQSVGLKRERFRDRICSMSEALSHNLHDPWKWGVSAVDIKKTGLMPVCFLGERAWVFCAFGTGLICIDIFTWFFSMESFLPIVRFVASFLNSNMHLFAQDQFKNIHRWKRVASSLETPEKKKKKTGLQINISVLFHLEMILVKMGEQKKLWTWSCLKLKSVNIYFPQKSNMWTETSTWGSEEKMCTNHKNSWKDKIWRAMFPEWGTRGATLVNTWYEGCEWLFFSKCIWYL